MCHQPMRLKFLHHIAVSFSPSLKPAPAVNVPFLSNIPLKELKEILGSHVHLSYPGVILHLVVFYETRSEFGPIFIS